MTRPLHYLGEQDGEWSPAPPQRPVPFITHVRIANYRSLRALDVKLGPLTVLVGPNGSGKSTFVDALEFLAEALATTPAQALEKRGGMSSVCSRVPAETNRFAIWVEARVRGGPLPEQLATAHYGFELAVNDQPGQRPFVIEREECRLEWMTAGVDGKSYTVRRGKVEQQRPNVGLPAPRIEADRLYLPTASAHPSLALLYNLLTKMAFYNFETTKIRAIQPGSVGEVLGRKGEHLGSVLGHLEESRPKAKQRVDEYLAAIVCDLQSVHRRYEGMYMTVEMQAGTGSRRSPVRFTANEMSDGTLRSAALLAALFQPWALEGRIPLVAIEEPEVTLHPAAAGVLFDAILEASAWVQVVATSHSADLLDRDDFPTDAIRAVTSDHGRAVIGSIAGPSLQTLRASLFTPGELLRGGQVTPDVGAYDLAQTEDFNVFGG